MNKLKKMLTVLVMTFVVLLPMLPTHALAIDPIDLNKTVSLSVKYNWDGTQFDLYRVADCDEFAVFTLNSTFSGYTGNINNWNNAEEWGALAQELAKYANANSIRPICSGVVKDKICVFSDLNVGLYLAVGHNVQVGNTIYTCNPFLVCLPDHHEDDIWHYDVTVQPKAGKSIELPAPPPELPQTGQLWWPVPVLACAGLVSLLIGVARRRGEPHE